MNKQKLEMLARVLELFEFQTLITTGMRMLSGGFATAEMYNYDEEFVDIELRWGVQSDCSDTVHTENYKLPVDALGEKNPAKALAKIQDS